MREILFKAKRIDNGEWICWNLYGELCRLIGKRTSLAIKNGATTHYYDYIHQVRSIIDEKTICEYTGLTDKNGNKIWENDIVTIKDMTSIGKVLFEKEYCSYLIRIGAGRYVRDIGRFAKDSEVIGNIFDNPELLQ